MQTNKKNKNIIGIIQSLLILILVVLVIFMMIQISRLQGTARVINYAGLVRGATQREVKLEITGNQNEELIKYLDDIFLVCLHFTIYPESQIIFISITMLFIYFLPILGTNTFNSLFHLFNIQRFRQMSVHTHGNALFSIFLECICCHSYNRYCFCI